MGNCFGFYSSDSRLLDQELDESYDASDNSWNIEVIDYVCSTFSVVFCFVKGLF